MLRSQTWLGAVLAGLLLAESAVIYLHDEPKAFAPEQALEQFRAEGEAGQPPVPSGTASARPSAPAASPTDLTRGAPATVAAPTASAQAARPAPGRSEAAPGGAVPEDVEPGVYTYATKGHEEVDALGGSRHDYPARSAVSYRRGGCGMIDEWQPLQGRVSTSTVCRGKDGQEPRRSTQRREFFGQSETQDLVCDPGLVLIPFAPKPGSSSTGRCRSSDTELRLTSRVVEFGSRVVGGVRTEAVHIRLDGTLTGKTRGSTSRDEWFTRGGLLLSAVATTDTDRDTAGGTVRYTETFELVLESLRPQR